VGFQGFAAGKVPHRLPPSRSSAPAIRDAARLAEGQNPYKMGWWIFKLRARFLSGDFIRRLVDANIIGTRRCPAYECRNRWSLARPSAAKFGKGHAVDRQNYQRRQVDR
jgi:hypothetical protein